MGVRVGQRFRMQLLRHSLVMALVVGVSYSAAFNPVGRVINAQTGEDIAIDKDNLDINGCLVGPSGERVCQYANFASDGQSRVSFRQNVGPGTSGSNGNAGPVSRAGKPIDPAAETYKKQIAAYQRWAEQQVKNAERQLGTA